MDKNVTELSMEMPEEPEKPEEEPEEPKELEEEHYCHQAPFGWQVYVAIIASFLGLAVSIILFIPMTVKVIQETGAPLSCFNCSAVKVIRGRSFGDWDHPDCAHHQGLTWEKSEFTTCRPNTTWCAFVYEVREHGDPGSNTSESHVTILRGCWDREPDDHVAEAQQEPDDHVAGAQQRHYSNVSSGVDRWEQLCSRPYCNDWRDYTQKWTFTNWVRETYIIQLFRQFFAEIFVFNFVEKSSSHQASPTDPK